MICLTESSPPLNHQVRKSQLSIIRIRDIQEKVFLALIDTCLHLQYCTLYLILKAGRNLAESIVDCVMDMDDDNGVDNRSQSSSVESASEEECLRLLLGFDIEDVPAEAWESDLENNGKHDAKHETTANSTCSNAQGAGRMPHSSIERTKYSDLPTNATRKIFDLSYHSTPDGQLTSPPVRVVDMQIKGNGMVALRSIKRGEVVFTERAAAAIQIPNTGNGDDDDDENDNNGGVFVRACQHCFRSLEPASSCGSSLPLPHLWPVQEYEEKMDSDTNDSNFEKEICGRVSCISCRSIFCSEPCRNSLLREAGSCCATDRALKAVGARGNRPSKVQSPSLADRSDQIDAPPTILLATRMFCTLLSHFRSTGDASLGMFEGMCGLPSDVDRLDLGLTVHEDNDATVMPRHHLRLELIFKRLSQALSLTASEEEIMSLELYCRLASIAALNGFEITTQSPFATYYTSLMRAAGGRGSERHQQYMKEVALTLGSQDGTLQRGMDAAVAKMVAVRLAALFPLTARINHSCEPCAEVKSEVFVDAHIDVVATRDIEEGEEITISYINIGRSEGRKDRHRRMKELRSRYLFECQCSRCANSSS